MSSLETTDRESAAVAKNPDNRVKLSNILDEIEAEHYVTLDEAVSANQAVQYKHLKPLSIMTLCVLIFRNGFVQIGYSAPADPDNFNADYERKLARENAIRDAWPKFGFQLCTDLMRERTAPDSEGADR